MDHLDLSSEALRASEYNPHEFAYQYYQGMAWPMSLDQPISNDERVSDSRPTTSLALAPNSFSYHQSMGPQRPMLTGNWQFAMPHTPQQNYLADGLMEQPYAASYTNHLEPLPMNYAPHPQTSMAPMDQHSTMASEGQVPFMPYTTTMEGFNPLAYYQNDLHNGLTGYPINQGMQAASFSHAGRLSSSPTDNLIDNQSASGSECGWQVIDYEQPISRNSFDSYTHGSNPAAVSNPGLTLHIRADSDTSQSDILPHSAHSFESFEEVQFPYHSPQFEGNMGMATSHNVRHGLPCQYFDYDCMHMSSAATCSNPSSPSTSPASPTSGSPSSRRKKSPTGKSAKPVFKKSAATAKKDGVNEKRVGRRRGPLRPEQRKQAGQIRKLRACLRCKFLKKTCDTGDPCAGCQPSHARLWQVPCTRIDIKDLGYFMKDWKADYERHVSVAFSVANIIGYASAERPLWITHGYGFILPITAREIFVRDEECFNVDWVESKHEEPREFDVPTARMTTGVEGISVNVLSAYLERHLDGGFERWVDAHFEGTAFLTEMLKTAHRFHQRTKVPIIRKALKLVLAYNLTLHVTLVEGLPEEECFSGRIVDEKSRYNGKTLAPVMINFQVKCALAQMWRELQKDVLEELSSLYSSVYSGEKLNNWPTIFILASILLAVWEEMQFDAHYRTPDEGAVKKFCNDMESTPVGVIVGLFSAISQKLPAFSEWDSQKHHQVLGSNAAVCDTMTEVRNHVVRYGQSFVKTNHQP